MCVQLEFSRNFSEFRMHKKFIFTTLLLLLLRMESFKSVSSARLKILTTEEEPQVTEISTNTTTGLDQTLDVVTITTESGPKNKTVTVTVTTAPTVSASVSAVATKLLQNLSSTKRKTDGQENLYPADFFQLNEAHLETLNNISENILNTNSNPTKPDELNEWDLFEAPYEIRKNFPYYLSGYDEDGRPIWVAELGKMNVRKVVEEGGENLRMLKKYCEQGAYIILKSLKDRSTPENPVTGAIAIVDMDELNIFQMAHFPTVSLLLELARKYQPLVEKHMDKGFVVNTNAVAHSMMNVVRPVFGRIFERIEIYGTQRTKWLPHLLQQVPKDQLPPWYGGSKNFRPVKVYGR